MRYRLFVIAILASVGFFNPAQIFSPALMKLLGYAGVLLPLLYCFAKEGFALSDYKFPKTAYMIVLAGILISIVPASIFHLQGFKASLITTLYYFIPYLFLIAMFKLNISSRQVIRTYFILAIASTFVYFVNVATAPNNFFGEAIVGEDMTRGVLRLPVVFIEMFPLLILYCINQWLINYKQKWIWIVAWLTVMVVLSVIRQIIALTAILTLLFMFRTIPWPRKVGMVMAVIATVVWVLPLIPVYNTMIELSEEQRDENEDTENIRFTAWRYYTTENQTNAITPLIGNGVPAFGQSVWGTMMDSETQDNGCYFVDVGWAGFFWLFGGIATGALLTLLLSAQLKPKIPDKKYLSYWFAFIILTSVASAPILYFHQIISITVGLYLVFNSEDTQTATQPSDGHSPDNTELQQRRRFPQLRRIGD